MKKLLLTLGAVASVAAPVAAVVACSNDNSTVKADYAFNSKDLIGNMSGNLGTPGDAVDTIGNATTVDTSLNLLAAQFLAAATVGIESFNFTLDGGAVKSFNFATDKFLTNGDADVTEVSSYLSANGYFEIVEGKLKTTDKANKDTTNLKLAKAKFVMRMAVAAKTALHLVPGHSWTMNA